jgi:hypothetical protein
MENTSQQPSCAPAPAPLAAGRKVRIKDIVAGRSSTAVPGES